MGKFEGHAIPGSALMVLGLFHILRSAPFRSLRSLRQRQFWVMAEPAALAIYCACAVMVEFTEMALPPSNFSMSHLDHIRVNSILSLCAWITLFHAYKVLQGPIWGLFYPGGLYFVGLLLSSHHQDTEIAAYAHQLTSLFFTLQAVMHAAEYCISLFINKSHARRVEAYAARWQGKNHDSGFSVSYYLFGLPALLSGMCCLRGRDTEARVNAKRREEEEVIAGINPTYTNPTIFSTPLPMLKGLVVLINGIWWWVMALYFFEERGDDGDFKMDVPEEFRSGPMMYHFIYADLMFPHLMWITGVVVVFFVTLGKLERYWYSNEPYHGHHSTQGGLTDVVNYALLEKNELDDAEQFAVELDERGDA